MLKTCDFKYSIKCHLSGAAVINFLNRKKKETTFKQNVLEFWDWFSKNSSMLHSNIASGQAAELSDEMIRQVNKLMPGMAWCFGPGKEKGRYSFTLSPEANRNFQFLTSYWLKMAPDIKDWDFLAANSLPRILKDLLSQ